MDGLEGAQRFLFNDLLLVDAACPLGFWCKAPEQLDSIPNDNNNDNGLNLYSAFLDTQRRFYREGGTSLTTTSV